MELYAVLEQLQIHYEEFSHPPVFTVEEAARLERPLEGEDCKNLFLKTKKGAYYLAILPAQKRTALKAVGDAAGVKHLSFASPQALEAILGLYPGSVSPFGIIHDGQNLVTVLVDRELEGKRLLFHPNTNTRTLSIAWEDLLRFFENQAHTWQVIEVPTETKRA